MLFFTFSMVHEFDWLFPPSPVAASTMTSVPGTDVAEEVGCEDEIEHDSSYVIIPQLDNNLQRSLFTVTSLIGTAVLTPPPDKA